MSARPAFSHVPVLMTETLAHLAPRPGGLYCDVTLGGGGHAERLLEASAPSGRVIGVDRDPEALRAASERLRRFGDRFQPLHGCFGDLRELLTSAAVAAVDGILADIGLSSAQLDQAHRGFSFRRPGPIDMRMDPSMGETALNLIERLDEEQLADMLYRYGQERRCRPIARAIKRAAAAGALTDTVALGRAIARAAGHRGAVDPATRTFQALRIAVNDELRQLDRLLLSVPACLRPGGRLVIISFHSLEDRIVKFRLRELAQPGKAPPRWVVLTRKPVTPGEAEIAENPRARSARLRAAERLPDSIVTTASGGHGRAPAAPLEGGCS